MDVFEIKDRLRRIDWLSKCGFELFTEGFSITQVKSWPDAQKSLLSKTWEDVRQIAAGDLHLKCREEYPPAWNTKISDARAFIVAEIMPAVTQIQLRQNLPEKLLTRIRWDLMHAIMLVEYAKFCPPSFYMNLFSVYELGHLPCDWDGRCPEGSLLIY